VEDGEDDLTAALREIQEEAGLTNLSLIADLGEFERHAIDPEGNYKPNELKVIKMFLFAAPAGAALNPEMKEEIAEARWVSRNEMDSTIGNEIERAWFASVKENIR
jgi:8-oxo-dGTP pyrophosphatase MutT (NUDIX family)